jgi:hypothetical protein
MRLAEFELNAGHEYLDAGRKFQGIPGQPGIREGGNIVTGCP